MLDPLRFSVICLAVFALGSQILDGRVLLVR